MIHAYMTGPRGAVKGDAQGDVVVNRAPSGLAVLTINARPKTWGGEWTGDVLAIYVTTEELAELGQRLTTAAAQMATAEAEVSR